MSERQSSKAMTIQDKVHDIRSMLIKSKDQIACALPRHMTADRMMRIAMTSVQRTPKLLDCKPVSLMAAVIQSAQLGLEPDGVLGHAYLVPYGDQVQLIPGYRGLIDLARRSGQVSTIYAQCVYEHDEFDYAFGLDPKLVHRPSQDDEPGRVVYVYAVCVLRDGGKQFDVMSSAKVEKVRSQSRAANNGPWVTHWEEMAKKTVLRRLCKMLPVSIELQRAVALDELADAGIAQNLTADLGIVEEPLPATFTNGPVSADDLTKPKPAPQVSQAYAQAIEAVGKITTLDALQQWHDAVQQDEETFSEEERQKLMTAMQHRRDFIEGSEKPKAKAKPKGDDGELFDKGSPSAQGA